MYSVKILRGLNLQRLPKELLAATTNFDIMAINQKFYRFQNKEEEIELTRMLSEYPVTNNLIKKGSFTINKTKQTLV